jgi:hypothetical protein
MLLKKSKYGVPQKFNQMTLRTKVGIQCHRYPVMAVACYFKSTSASPPNLFSNLEQPVLQILVRRRVQSFSTASVTSRNSN